MTNEPGNTILSAVKEYNDLLARMGDLTDQLCGVIRDSRMDAIETLLGARQLLCEQIASVSNEVQRYLDSPNYLSDTQLRDAVARASQLQAEVMQKQTVCQSVLAGRLQECKTELNSLGQRRGLASAYSTPNGASQSRYLDNRT